MTSSQIGCRVVEVAGSSLAWVRRRAERSVRRLALKLARLYGTRRDAVGLSHSAWREIGRRRYQRAVLLAQAAVASDPSYAHGHRMLGLAYARLGDPARARNAYEEGIAIAPGEPWLLVALGDVERGLGRHAEAEPLYRRALELEPQNVEAFWALGQALRGQSRPQEAEEVLRAAYAIAPDDVRVVRALGVVLFTLRRFPEALPLLARTIERAPADGYVRCCLALTLDATGNRQAAIEEAGRAVELEPDSEWSQGLLQRLLHGPRPPASGNDPQ